VFTVSGLDCAKFTHLYQYVVSEIFKTVIFRIECGEKHGQSVPAVNVMVLTPTETSIFTGKVNIFNLFCYACSNISINCLLFQKMEPAQILAVTRTLAQAHFRSQKL